MLLILLLLLLSLSRLLLLLLLLLSPLLVHSQDNCNSLSCDASSSFIFFSIHPLYYVMVKIFSISVLVLRQYYRRYIFSARNTRHQNFFQSFSQLCEAVFVVNTILQGSHDTIEFENYALNFKLTSSRQRFYKKDFMSKKNCSMRF